MPRITNIPSRQSTVTTGTNAQIRSFTKGQAGLLAEGQQGITRTIDRMMRTQLANYDSYKKQADRAGFKASQMMSSALQNIPKAFEAIAATATNTMDEIYKINEAEIESRELPIQEETFGNVMDIAGDNVYSLGVKKAQENLGADGKYEDGRSAQEVLVGELDQMFQESGNGKGPSAAAEMDAFAKNQLRKIEAQQTAQVLEKDARFNTRLANMDQAIDDSLQLMKEDPERYFLTKKQITRVNNILEKEKVRVMEDDGVYRRAGFPEEAIKIQKEAKLAMLEQKQAENLEKVDETAVRGLLDKGEDERALQTLNNPNNALIKNQKKLVALNMEIGTRLVDKARNTRISLETSQAFKDIKEGLFVTKPTKNQKQAIDLMYQSFIGQRIAGYQGEVTPGVAAMFNTQFYRENPNIPMADRHKNQMIGQFRNGDVESVEIAASTIDALENDPATAHILGEKNFGEGLEFAAIYKQKREFGIDPERALEETRKDMYNTDPNMIRMAKDIMSSNEDFDYNEWVKEALADKGFLFDSNPENHLMVAYKYKEEFTRALARSNGDLEIAKKVMEKRLGNEYRLTDVNGRKESMKFAPEKILPGEYVQDFKDKYSGVLKQISTTMGVPEDSLKDNTISIKQADGSIRDIEVDMREIPGITSNTPNEAKIFGLYERETGLPLRLSTYDPELPANQLTFQYDMRGSDIYKNAYQKSLDNLKKDKEFRQSEYTKNEALIDNSLNELKGNSAYKDTVEVVGALLGKTKNELKQELSIGEAVEKVLLGPTSHNERIQMANDRFMDGIIANTLKHEGGFVNDPADRGGATNYGVTIGTLSRHLGRKATVQEVKDLTKEEAIAIYRKDYLEGPKINKLPVQVMPKVFDMSINHGPSRGIKILQKAINKTGIVDKISVDGIIGPKTIEATNKVVRQLGGDFVNSLVEERNSFYERIIANRPANAKFRRGWLRRSNSFKV